MTLDMREACERWGAALAADGDAVICSYECTFCTSCGDALERVCPNCGGELVRRPIRPREKLAKFPASTERKLKAGGCAPPRAA